MRFKSSIFQCFFACISIQTAVAAQPCPPDVLGVSRILEVGTQGGLQIGLKTYPRTLALADHEIVLTFDDGPAAGTTPKVLDALAKECVKATFFLIGRNAEALPSLVKRTLAEGHTIGHHSFSHPAATLRKMDEAAARKEIDRGIAAVERAAYGAGGTAPHAKFFRFPGFADTSPLDDWLATRDIAVIATDLWASDWLPMTPEAELTLLFERLEKEGRGIVLLHDIKRQTAAMLPAFLRELKKRGFAIVHIMPGIEPPPIRDAPPGWHSTTDQILSEALRKRNAAQAPNSAKLSNTPKQPPATPE